MRKEKGILPITGQDAFFILTNANCSINGRSKKAINIFLT